MGNRRMHSILITRTIGCHSAGNDFEIMMILIAKLTVDGASRSRNNIQQRIFKLDSPAFSSLFQCRVSWTD
jgi:hypothetical protein